MTTREPDDLAVDNDRMNEVLQYFGVSEAARRRFTAADAENLANFSRMYMSPSPDVAAAVAESGVDYRHPLLGEINMRDAEEQNKGVYGRFKALMRGGTALAEGLWEEGFSRPMRTAVRAYQDDTDQSLLESWREAGPSDLAMAVGEVGQGNQVNWGEGLMPESTLAHEVPGFGQELAMETQQRVQAGTDPGQAYEQSFAQLSDAYYDAQGRPITYEGQEIRESTLIHKTRNGVTYASPVSLGRAAAIQVFDPNTPMFNIMSGGIDASARIGWDPINVPADEITRAWRVRNAVVPVDNIAEAGLTASRRPWINPKTAEQWFQTGRGTRMVEVLTETDTLNDMNKLVGELPVRTQRKLVEATTPEDVQNVLKPFMGTTVLPQGPTLTKTQTLGNVIHDGGTTVSRFNPDSMLSRTHRRLMAQSGTRMVSAHDIDAAIPAFRNMLDTAGVQVDETERILNLVADAEGNINKLEGAYSEAMEAVGVRLGDIGYDETDMRYILGQLSEEHIAFRTYLNDEMGTTVIPEGAETVRMIKKDGTFKDVPMGGAHLDSEFANQGMVLPSLRDIRRGTSRSRAGFQQADTLGRDWWSSQLHRSGWEPGDIKGIEPMWAAAQMDKVQSVWRQFALLRAGWALRVIPEEAMRMAASGYSQMLTSPGHAVLATILDPKMADVFGDSLTDYFKIEGLGASGFVHGADNLPIDTNAQFIRSRTSWDTVPTMHVDPVTGDYSIRADNAVRAGLATEFQQLRYSKGGQKVAELGVDEAFDYFHTAEGREIIDDIVMRSGGGITSKLKDDELLRRWLESVDARIAQHTGGDYIYRKYGETDWLDSMGDPIDNPIDWTDTRVKQELLDMEQKGIYSAGGQKMTAVDRKEKLLDLMGYPNLDEFADRQFVVIKNGKDELRKTISGENDVLPSAEAFNRKQMMEFEDWLVEQYDDVYRPSNYVKTAKPADDKNLRRFTDAMFEAIMEKNTMRFVRSPYARMRYTEEMAAFSLWADAPTRRQLTAWAKKEGVLDQYRDFQKKALEAKGLRKMPTGVDNPASNIDDIDTLAKGKAIADSKALFYDLAEKQNWADAIRFIAPFADAWQEVLTRWANLLTGGSIAGPGQAIRNWERIRTGTQAFAEDAERQKGFFGKNEFGDRVFNLPGGILPSWAGGQDADAMMAQFDPTRMLFLDPSSPRSVLAPGMGPFPQVAGSFVQPALKDMFGVHMTDAINSYLFGEFAPKEYEDLGGVVNAFTPSWIKRVTELMFDEQKERAIGDEILDTYSSLLLSGDDRFGDATEEMQVRTRQQARDTGNQIAFMRIFDAAVLPTAPQYQPGFFLSLNDAEEPEFWMGVAAVSDELRTAEEVFGDPTMARQYILDRFGYDPLNVTSGTQFVKARPTTADELSYLEEHPELREWFDYTLMAFVPKDSTDEFFFPAWQAAKGEDARVDVSVEEGAQAISRQKGNMAYAVLKDTYSRALKQATEKLGSGSAALSDYRKQLDQWRYNEVNNLSVEFFAWGYDKEIAGSTNKPTYEQVYTDAMGMTIEGSEKRRIAGELNPGYLSFMDHAKELIDVMEEGSASVNAGPDWWRTVSDSSSLELRAGKRDLHTWFITGLQWKVDELETAGDEAGVMAAKYALQYIFTPLIDGVEYREAVFYPPLEPPPPGQPYGQGPLEQPIYDWEEAANG